MVASGCEKEEQGNVGQRVQISTYMTGEMIQKIGIHIFFCRISQVQSLEHVDCQVWTPKQNKTPLSLI